MNSFPEDIFPEDKKDPTAGAKEPEYHVERTLGVMGHVRTIAKKRKWLFLQIEAGSTKAGEVSHIREFYKLPNAPVTHQNGMWAIWSGEGEPTVEAFPETDENEMAAAASPGTVVATQEAADLKATMDEVAKRKAGTLILDEANETWAYTSNTSSPIGEIRRRFKAGASAPFEVHPSGDIAAVWLGKGAPARPAFPAEAGRIPNGHPAISNGHAAPVTPGITQLDGTLEAPATPAVKPVSVSPFAPGNALNEMGLKLYGMSKEEVFSDDFRAFLKRCSDSLHAEAARFDVAKVRASFDRTYPGPRKA